MNLLQAKPKAPIGPLDTLIDQLIDARRTYQKLEQHSKEWHARVTTPVKLHPEAEGIPLRDFKAIDPMGEWLPADDLPVSHLNTLSRFGLIAMIEIKGDWYARPAP